MSYTIVLSREAESDLNTLFKSDRKLFNRVLNKIESLSEKPMEGKPLVANHKGEFSLRVSRYCIVCELETTNHIVYILTVKHRKNFY